MANKKESVFGKLFRPKKPCCCDFKVIQEEDGEKECKNDTQNQEGEKENEST